MGPHQPRQGGGECRPPERPPLGVCLVYLGHRLSYLIDRRLAPLDLNRTQGMIVMALRRHPGLMALDLAGPVWVEPPSVTRAVQTLERRGLVARQPHPSDGRASLFYLTPAGESVADDIECATRRADEALEAALSPEQRESLDAALGVLADRIEALWENGCPEPCASPDQAFRNGSTPSKGSDR